MLFSRDTAGNTAGNAGGDSDPGPAGDLVTITARFERVELGLLRLATSQLIALLTASESHALGSAADPALKRLLPDAYTDDPEAAAEFRRFTAGDLLDGKLRNARTLLATLGEEPLDAIADDPPDSLVDGMFDAPAQPVSLDAAGVQAWLRTLTDLRLTLAERLQITPDGVQHLGGDEGPLLGSIYEWLGMVQESLVYAVDV